MAIHQNTLCFQTTNNSCAYYILSLSDRDIFDLPLPPFLPAQAQHRALIDTDRFYPSSAKHKAQGTKNFALYFLILTFPEGHFYTVPRILPHGKAKIHCSYLYQISRLIVKENILNFAYFLQRHQAKSETPSKTQVEAIAVFRLWLFLSE